MPLDGDPPTGTGPTPAVAGLLARTRLQVDSRTFTVAGVPPSYDRSVRIALADLHAPFYVQVFPHEVTIVLPEGEWTRVRQRFPGSREEAGYRLITLEADLDWQVTGYLAVVTDVLAGAGIPVAVLSSFHHDHVLVRGDYLDNAVAALQHLLDTARAATAKPD